MCRGIQDAKVIFDGHNQQLSTKSVKQARRVHKNISQADFLSNVKERSFDTVSDQSLKPASVDVQQATSCVVSMVIYFAPGVLDAPTVALGNGRDVLVELIARAQWHLALNALQRAILTPQGSTLQSYWTQQVNAR